MHYYYDVIINHDMLKITTTISFFVLMDWVYEYDVCLFELKHNINDWIAELVGVMIFVKVVIVCKYICYTIYVWGFLFQYPMQIKSVSPSKYLKYVKLQQSLRHLVTRYKATDGQIASDASYLLMNG